MHGGGGRFRVNHRGGGGQPKERDNDDLLLFKELHKREKDQAASLLQPFSDEFEINAAGTHHSFYRIPSGKKDGSQGYEFFGGGNGGKSDYDWLKTPPATPLFPSLEMEASRPDLLVQREITVVQPRSRFAAIPESGKARSTSSSTTTSPPTTATKSSPTNSSSRPKIPTSRSSSNGRRPTHSPPAGNEAGPNAVQYGQPKPTTDPQPGPKLKPVRDRTTTTTAPPASTMPSKVGKSSNDNNYKIVQHPKSSSSSTKSRGLSPTVRSNIAVVAAAVATSASNHHRQAKPNLDPPSSRTAISSSRVDRASSTSRVRSRQLPSSHHQGHTVATTTTGGSGKPRSTSSSSRPRVSTTTTTTTISATTGEGNYVHHQRGKFGGSVGGPRVFGSKMVDRVMSARKSSTTTSLGVGQHQDKVQGSNGVKPKPKPNVEGLGNGGEKAGGTTTGGPTGFGRILALRNMELNRDRNNMPNYNQSTRS